MEIEDAILVDAKPTNVSSGVMIPNREPRNLRPSISRITKDQKLARKRANKAAKKSRVKNR
jgi:hypothetical protein